MQCSLLLPNMRKPIRATLTRFYISLLLRRSIRHILPHDMSINVFDLVKREYPHFLSLKFVPSQQKQNSTFSSVCDFRLIENVKCKGNRNNHHAGEKVTRRMVTVYKNGPISLVNSSAFSLFKEKFIAIGLLLLV